METALEQVLQSFRKDKMIEYLTNHPEEYTEAIELALGDKQPYSWRAAWLLFDCLEANDARLRGYIDHIIRAIPSKKDGHQRELLKILSMMELGEDHEGIVFDICMNTWEKIHLTPSVRYTAFRLMLAIASKYPELLREIELLTDDNYTETLSPGVRHSLVKLLNTYKNPSKKKTTKKHIDQVLNNS